MSMTPAELELKVRQLDNDVESIYEALSAIQGTQTRHTNRLRELDEKLGGIDTQVTGVDSKVVDVDGKVTGLDSKLTGLDDSVTGLDTKLDSVLELLRSR
jgi:chromosome segregation ATPase